ncbi:MAG: 3-hydroxyacyl-ACP dehydratase FabZ [Bacteroidales bacterium]|nr:3-hydroxyacyl-ACP dehydratase FabZ [Bacteroidales bacterium]
MEREEIMKLLPHRSPMLLVDESHWEGDEVVSTYHVNGDEFFLQGHFPGNPVVPGVILCEMMAQGSFMLMTELLDGKTLTFLTGLDNVRFKHPVVPGDTLTTHSKMIDRRGNIIFLEAKADVDGTFCCSARITIVLKKI